MASNTEHNEIIVMDSMKEILECPVCTVVPSNGPMHQCKNGHIVCNRCKPQLLNGLCPTCRDPIVGRAMNIEKLLLELAPRPCKFSQSGCTIKLVPSLLRNHETDCEKKLLQCPNVHCSTKILPKYLDEHLKKSESCEVILMGPDEVIRLTVDEDIFVNNNQSVVPSRINSNMAKFSSQRQSELKMEIGFYGSIF
jgi:hypothetical protein